MKATLDVTYRMARRIVIATVGATVLVIGLALLVLPGPAFVVIPTGLAILGLEFAWARHWLHRIKDGADGAWDILKRYRQSRNRGEENRAGSETQKPVEP